MRETQNCVTIYGIRCPLRKQIVYVGQTMRRSKRWYEHLYKLSRHDHENGGLQAMYAEWKAAGKRPRMIALETVGRNEANAREAGWIANLSRSGMPLCNAVLHSPGGEWTDRRRKRISNAVRRKYDSDPAYRRRIARLNRSRRAAVGAEREATPLIVWGMKQASKRRAAQKAHEYRAKYAAMREAKAEEHKRLMQTITAVTVGGVAYIPLTRGKYAMVDSADAHRVSMMRWSAQNKSGYWRAKRNTSKAGSKSAGIMLLNRFIVGAGSDVCVRHINGNQLDCRRSNLSIEHTQMPHARAA